MAGLADPSFGVITKVQEVLNLKVKVSAHVLPEQADIEVQNDKLDAYLRQVYPSAKDEEDSFGEDEGSDKD